MGAFGDKNYGTKFGALDPNTYLDTTSPELYNYSGFSSFSSYCGPYGLEFIPFRPTLTFPLNFDIFSGVIPITWKEAVPADVCGDGVVYELQFTRSFSRDAGWKTLASDMPARTTSLNFDVSEIPFTEDAGLRIRARDSKGLYSDWSHSNEAFTIANHPPNQVVILSPFPNDQFDYCIQATWREPAIRDIDGHDVTYSVEMTSRYSDDDGWTVVPTAGSLPNGTTGFTITSFDFPEGSDYGLRVTATDELGLSSPPKMVGPFKILHRGNFIIDTLPPEGTVSINDGAALAANTTVKLSLFATDISTGIKDVRFKNEEEDCWSDWDSFANEKLWVLPSTDGVKRVFVQYRDYAENVSEACDCEIVSRVLCDKGNVTDIEVYNNKLYVAFDVNGNLVEYRILVDTAAALPEPVITALARFSNSLYVATFDDTSGTSVYSFDGRATKKFGIAGAKALSMQAYNDKLYIGLDDGRIKEYDGTSEMSVYSATSAITRLRTDGAVLYASIQGGGEYAAFDGTTWTTKPF